MKIVTLLLLFVLLMAAGCGTNTPKTKAPISTVDTSQFYPIPEFLHTQIQYVDLRNFHMYKIFEKDGKKDSSGISKEQFIAFANTFYDTAITAAKFRALYQETVFHDLSTKSYTLHYSPINHNAKLQNIDVLLDEDTHMAKRILIRTVYDKGDTSITENFNWKAYKSFQVSRSLETNNGYHSTEFIFIKWNDTP